MKRITAFLFFFILSIFFISCTPKGNELQSDKNDGAVLSYDSHTPLSREEYYQYSFLNENEKNIYNRINESVQEFDRVIEISDISMPDENKMKIVECFIADNPQYFWVCDSYSLDNKGNICLLFSDGTVTDDRGYGDADINKIIQRQDELEKIVKNILSLIDPQASEQEKEKIIYNYIIENTEYNDDAAKAPFLNGNMSSAYNIYGVLVEKNGVCYGYTRAFQYLCNLVGINSNQVMGYAHIWNTVKIDGQWYQVDVTWSDFTSEQYKYFNLSPDIMYSYHKRNTDDLYRYLRVPQ